MLFYLALSLDGGVIFISWHDVMIIILQSGDSDSIEVSRKFKNNSKAKDYNIVHLDPLLAPSPSLHSPQTHHIKDPPSKLKCSCEYSHSRRSENSTFSRRGCNKSGVRIIQRVGEGLPSRNRDIDEDDVNVPGPPTHKAQSLSGAAPFPRLATPVKAL